MNMIILNGSPRPKGNTMALLEAFQEKVKDKGHDVTLYNVAELNIKGCIGCEYCHNKGEGTCIQNDGMNDLYPQINQADFLLIASPVYYFNFTGQLQSFISRLYAIGIPKQLKQTALILTSGSDDVYEGIEYQYHRIFNEYMKAEDRGVIKVFGKGNKSNEALEEAIALANAL